MSDHAEALQLNLRSLKLPSFAACHEEIGMQAEREGWSFSRFLLQLSELELHDRQTRKIDRQRRASGLPADKTLATLETKKLPTKVRRALSSLCEGGFADRAENVLAFGLPGRGKTHCACAIGHELIDRGYSVLFRPAYQIVQQLLTARRDLELEREIRRLDRFDVVILDDIGYVQQDRQEMEVLFTFLAERYERRSVMITSNLVFSQWDQIFKDAMTTAAAIDRLVHHATILELAGDSFRTQAAKRRHSSAVTDAPDE
jgi:DNA replication protein DnaC